VKDEKGNPEARYVRQALIDTLEIMARGQRKGKLSRVDLIDAQLQELIMFGFVFDGADLSNANLSHCDLGNASFVNAKLWRADLSHSKLTNADFTNAQLWDANLGNANLENAIVRTPHTNAATNF
jgi:uncharacterized protein YjbI with pentapeptide repeats